MLLIGEAIPLILNANAALVALVSTRMWPGSLPQTATYPALAYRKPDSRQTRHLGGSTGLASSTYRFFSAATKATGGYGAATRVNEALRMCFEEFDRGFVQVGSPVTAEIFIQGIEPDITGDHPYDDQTQTYQVYADYIFTHSIQMPTP